MRVVSICILPALLLSCGKTDAPSTPLGTAGPSKTMSDLVFENRDGGSFLSVEATQQPAKAVNACEVQDGKPLTRKPRHAVGTEPFWGAQIDGRCVRYSHMEDEKGARVWSRYTQNAAVEIWSGTLNGKLFELKLQNDPNCSDGMSDKRYPFSVELKVGIVLRAGCAEPN